MISFMTLASRVLEIRKKLNLSQPKFAELIGIKYQSLQAIEKGETRYPRNLEKIAEVGKVPLEWLLYGVETRTKIPVFHWHNIKKIHRNSGLDLSNPFKHIDVSFPDEKDLYATIVPKVIIPGRSNAFFSPDDHLLISPHREPFHESPIVIIKSDWLAPEFAEYVDYGDTVGYRYAGEGRPRKIPSDLKICGVIVARLNIYIPS